MIVAGVMSGTSADGINVALVRVKQPLPEPPKGAKSFPRLQYLAHSEFAYPKQVRAAVLAAMNAKRASVADLARLNFRLGQLYAEAVVKTQKAAGITAELVGCHGQTLFHQGEPETFLGGKIAVTWQTGEGSVVAARLGVPVISDFRPADLAAGGKGAPLVPFLDYLLYRSDRVGRIVQNIGGIANLTAIPPQSMPEEIIAFDTGPGNMVIDAVTERIFGKSFDRDGKIAGRGRVLESVVNHMTQAPFFLRRPPKTAGREDFGREYVDRFLARCRKAKPEDIVSTATALTSRSIRQAIERFVLSGNAFSEMVVSGGGTRNLILMEMLAREMTEFKIRIRLSDEFGLPSEAKEAAAIALLAYQTWNHQPSNMPSATGAKRSVILGKISYA